MTSVTFVEKLKNVTLDNVFNPYADRCPLHDLPDAPSIRSENLLHYLDVALATGVDSIWIGRDLGFRGGRRTGLALTDEAHLPCYAKLFDGLTLLRATHGDPVTERTATIVWHMLLRISRPIFLWNAFPFHPHKPSDPMTNRAHRRKEREIADVFLADLIELLDPGTVVAVGKDAYECAHALGITDAICVRHPSYGGQAEFIATLEVLYDLLDTPARTPDLFPSIKQPESATTR